MIHLHLNLNHPQWLLSIVMILFLRNWVRSHLELKDLIVDFAIVIPPPEEYQHDSQEQEKRMKLLNDEVQQLRLHNRVNLNR